MAPPRPPNRCCSHCGGRYDGTLLIRTYKGRSLAVEVLADGFAYEGERFPSLSAVAKHITGSHVNGYRFFGLGGAV